MQDTVSTGLEMLARNLSETKYVVLSGLIIIKHVYSQSSLVIDFWNITFA